MKRNKAKFTNRLRFIALAIVALVAVLAFATDYMTASYVTIAFATVVGNITLEGKEEQIYLALKETITSEQEKFSKGYITEQKMLDTIATKLKEMKVDIADNEEFKKLKKALDDMGLEIKSITENGKPIYKSVKQQIKEQLTARKTEWEQFLRKELKGFTFNIDFTSKAAATMLYSSHGNDSVREEMETGITDIARKQPSVISQCAYGTTSSESYSYIQKINQEGNAAVTNEGTIAPLIDFELDKVTSTAVDIPGRIEVSENFLADVDGMADAITGELRYQVDIAADDAVMALISGSGSAYAQTGISVLSPNTLDCIRAAATRRSATRRRS